MKESQVKPSAKPGFRPDIEGLRAVAVVAVVLFHADIPGVGGGYIGVDVFFVISGFLITGLLSREVSTAGTVRLRRFYGARARRLLPASATVGVVTALAAALLLPPLQAHSAFGDGIASALYVGNYWFILHGVDYLAPVMPASPFEHYWSLGVEEQFYLVWPPLIIGTAWLVRRRRRRRRSGAHAAPSQFPYVAVLAIVAATSFVLSLVVTYVIPAVAFFSLPTRAWQLAAGGLLALTASRLSRIPALPAAIAGWAGLAVILLACTLLNSSTLYPGVAALLPVLGAGLVIGAGCAAASPHGCGRLLALSPMQAVGRLSYSWYLWHWPVLLFTPLLLGHELGLVGRLMAILVSVGLAVLTLRLIENPLRFAESLRQSPIRSLAVGAAATAVAVCVCVALSVLVPNPGAGRGEPAEALSVKAGDPPLTAPGANAYEATVQQDFEQVQAAVAASLAPGPVPSNLNPPLTVAASELKGLLSGGCMRNGVQAGQPECATGDTSSATTVALIGDSHAVMWRPALQQVAEERGWRLETMSKAVCPLLDLPIENPIRRVVSRCGQWRDEIIDRLRAKPPKLVVVSMWRGYVAGQGGYDPGFTSYNPAWNDSLTRLVKQLRSIGSEVLVLGPIPDPHQSVPICLSGHLEDATACAMARSTAVNESGIAAENAATVAGGGEYVNLTELFCTAQRCPVIVGNTLVYFDWTHVTSQYSRQLAPVVGRWPTARSPEAECQPSVTLTDNFCMLQITE